MGIINKWKTKREIKRILQSKDSEKLDSIDDFNKDENLENIILNIKDKQKRAQALEKSIHKIDDKEILKSIIRTLKDDDILKILQAKIEYLDNEERNILYTTISGIDNVEKRIKAIKRFYMQLSDIELADLLCEINDKDMSSKKEKKSKQKQDSKEDNMPIEEIKIDIISNKIITNYINTETLLHMRELLGAVNLDISKVEIVERALKKEKELQERINKGEIPPEYISKDKFGNTIIIKNSVFDEKGKRELIEKSFKYISGTNNVERRKKELILELYKQGVYSYEEARTVSKAGIKNECVERETKEKLLKLEGKKKFIQEIKEKDLIKTPITVEKTGEIVDISEDIEL